MGIGWFAVLQAVPWSQVIENAPKVAEGAKKLWSTVAGKQQEALVTGGAEKSLSPEAQALASIEHRVAALETRTAELRSQMLESSELLKTLAEQNTELIRRIEANRVRTLWLSATSGVALLVSGAALFLVLTGS